MNENTTQLSNETSNFDETSQASPQAMKLQSSYDKESRIRDILKELQ